MLGPLAEPVREGRIFGNLETPISGIKYDSRLVEPGDLFAALSGSADDGHLFVPDAIARGAAAILVERLMDASVPQLIASNSRAALADCSAEFYGHPSRELMTIGLTGTDGKTTTSFLVHDVFRQTGHPTGMIGTVGITIGQKRTDELSHQTTPESNLVHGYLREMVEAGVDTAIVEATSHGLAMHRLDGVEFDIAGVTNITREHLEFHGTVERYRQAKTILLTRVASRHGVVVLNADDPGAMSVVSSATGADLVFYSAGGGDAHIRAERIVLGNRGTRFDAVIDGTSCTVVLPLIGDFNVANALCAIGVCRAADVPLSDIIAALGNSGGAPGRMNRIFAGQPFTVIVDYAHTPESLRKVLSLLRGLQGQGRLIVVTGSAGERDTGKRPLQGAVCSELADICIFTNEDPRHEDAEQVIGQIAAGAVAHGGIPGQTVFSITDRSEAITYATALAEPGDTLLLAGKGHERSIIIGHEYMLWDEAKVARDALQALGYTCDKEGAVQ